MATNCPAPKELMFDIFSRLSIQDLSRCRFVCKGWYGIISDPLFVDFHHQSRNEDPNFIVILDAEGPTLCLIDTKTMSTQLKAKPISIIPLLDCSPYIVGSANGLLCLSQVYNPPSKLHLWQSYYLLNPITNEMAPLPRAPSFDGSKYVFCMIAQSGFAFDATTKTHKLIQSWCIQGEGDEVRRVVFDAHTIGSGEWRRIHEIARVPWVLQETPVFVNNALHWETFDPQYGNLVHAIDVGTETLTSFKSPPPYGYANWHRSMTSLKGCLSFFNNIDDSLVVWVMKDYGVEESWRRLYVISRNFMITKNRLKTVTTMKNGSTLLDNGKHLIYYNFENKEYQPINIHGLPPDFHKFKAAVAHIGSFISPKSIAAAAEINWEEQNHIEDEQQSGNSDSASNLAGTTDWEFTFY